MSLPYDFEANLKHGDADRETIVSERRTKDLQIMDGASAYTMHSSDPIGKAIDCDYKFLLRLRRYALDGSYSIDNMLRNAVYVPQ